MSDKDKSVPNHFSLPMREQLKEALETYRLKSGYQETYYHDAINEALNLSGKQALTHAKMRSLRAGRKSNLKTLKLLFRFVCKVDPNFKFVDSGRDTHIEAAMNLKRFSMNPDQPYDTKQKAFAQKLDKNLFVSLPHDDRPSGTDLLISFVCFKWIQDTPFLLVYKFSMFCGIRGQPSRHLHISDSTSFGIFYADIFDEFLNSSSDISFMRDIEKGYVVPLGDNQSYFGILKNENNFPRQVQFIAWENKTYLERGFTLRAIGDSERASLGLRFEACGKLHNIERVVFEMKEPTLLSAQ
jgi:hypothetical protein